MPADLQIHTDQSDGMDTAATIFQAALRRGLDTVAITDHDQTRGALIARELAAQQQHQLDVIVGSEVTSRGGHMLALWIEDPIPAFRSPARTVELIWQQGGAAIIAHPAAVLPFSLGLRAIDRLVETLHAELSGDDAPILAIETSNPIPFARWRRETIIRANRERWGLAETGGSDAHFWQQVGSSLTEFEGRGAADLRAALQGGATTSRLADGPRLGGIGAKRLLQQPWRGLTATPRALLAQRRGTH